VTGRGPLSRWLYRDINGNGIRYPGEPLEKNVQISAGRIPVENVTDANGEVIVDDLEPFQPVLIGVEGSSLPDPLFLVRGRRIRTLHGAHCAAFG
jgi:hypothetical protein